MTPREPSSTCPRARAHGGRLRVRAGGFTLVEILVAIGIIVVLVGIVLVGTGKITGQSKENATRVNLDNLRSMLAEYESKDDLGGLRDARGFDPVSGTLASPGNVTREVYPEVDHRYKHPAVDPNTRGIIAKLLALPPNKTAMSRISPSQILPDDDTTSGVNEAQWNILLDGWGNPIIFVPGGGMTGVTVGGTAQPIVKSRDNRPYWASAGPDGDFSKGDDNLYSSEEVKYAP